MTLPPICKHVVWVGRSKAELLELPKEVHRVVGFALDIAQRGLRARGVKPLSGYGGASVLEVVDDYDGDTYRAVYTIRFPEAVYVLCVFQKKSTHGIATASRITRLIDKRLAEAERLHRAQRIRRPDKQPFYGEG